MAINNHGNSRGATKNLKGSMYRELPSELVTQIEKMPPLLPHKEMEEMLQNSGEQQVISEA